VSEPRLDDRGVVFSHPDRRYITETIFGIHLSDQVHKLLLISYVFQREQMMGIQLYMSAETTLMKQNLRNQNLVDTFVMAASRRQGTQLIRRNVVQQIV